MKLNSSIFAGLMRPLLASTAFAALALTANAAGYLKLGDIKGESTDNDHKDWINLVSVSTAMARPVAIDPTTGQRRRGSVILEDIVVVKELDKSSPKLMEACATGLIVPVLELELTKQVGDAAGVSRGPVTYYKYELKNVIVTSYSVSGSTGGQAVPTEQVSFSYEEVKVTYTEFDKQTGASKGNIEYSWKVEEGE